MNKSLLIIGAGEYGQVIKEIAELNGFEKIEFLDDKNPIAIGKINQLETKKKNFDYAICSIGNPEIREKISRIINNKIALIHPYAFVSKTAKIEKSCVIEAGVIINSYSVIKEGSLICAGSIINHNAIINEYCQVDCNAVVKGVVPNKTKIESCTVWKEK